jgi:hypothetical protein
MLQKGLYAKWHSADGPIPDAILNNTGLRGVQLVDRWYEVHKGPGVFDWTNADARMQQLSNTHLHVIKEVTDSLRWCPPWLTDEVQKGSGTGTITLVKAQNGATETAPLPWGPEFVAYRQELTKNASAHWGCRPRVVAVHMGWGANWNYCEPGLPSSEEDLRRWHVAGYDADAMLAVCKHRLSSVIWAFSLQRVTFSFHQLDPILSPGAKLTSFSTSMIDYALKQPFGQNVICQVDYFSAHFPAAGSFKAAPDPNTLPYLAWKLAGLGRVGFEFVDSIVRNPALVWGQPNPPSVATIFDQAMSRAISYPGLQNITIQGADAQAPELADKIVEWGNKLLAV